MTTTGAKGDGITDDTAAFQNALGQLNAAGGGTLQVPQGTYLIQSGAVTVTGNITVAGTQATLKAGTVGYPLLDVSGSNITISGLTIDGSNTAVGGISLEAGATNILVTNDVLQNFTQPADPNNSFYYAVPFGVHVYGNGNGITFDAVAIKNVVAINTNGPSWPHKVARGIWMDPSSGQTTSKNITIKNSSFYEIAPKDDGDCIVIQDSSAYANLQIVNNTFDRCHKRAIKIQVPGAYIANNTINNPFLGDNKYDTYPEANTYDMYSAVSAYASNVVITGNTVKGIGSFYNAIDMDAGTGVTLSTISVQNNNIAMGSGANLSASSLIRALVPVDELTVTNNQLSYATWGIRADGALTRPYVQNNTITNVTTPIQCATACQAPYAPSVAIPAYFAPGALWTQMDQGAPPVGIAVMNPGNGPGGSSDPAYVSQVQTSQQAGLAVLGYVYTKYANSQPDPLNGGTYDRTIAAVEADIDNYFAWYRVDGIFLDEVTNTCDSGYLSYYTTLVTYIKEKGGKGIVALNPGTATGECYLTAAPAADTIVTFEGHYSTYVSSGYAQPSWVVNYSPSRFWHLVYDTPDVASLQNAMSLVKQRGAGWYYVTPQGSGTSNPWGGLPSDPYWSIELGKQPPSPGLVNGTFAAGLTGWTPFCRTWGQVPLTPTSTCGNFATTSAAGLQLSAAGTSYNQPYIGVTQTVATSANVVLGGTVTVNTMDTCNTDGSVLATARLLNAGSTELGSIVFYHHPYTSGCTPYLYASTSTVYFQDMPTWLPSAGPQNFTMDVAALIAQHLPGVNAAQVAAITVELMNYADFTRPTVTFDNLSLSPSPVSVISTVAPAAAAAGAAPLTLTVNGANFATGAVVQWDWNGQTTNLLSSVQSSAQLSVTVPVALLNTTGIAYLSVISAGAASNQVPFFITNSGTQVSGSNTASGSGAVTATSGAVTTTASSGSGTVTVVQYAANPAPSTNSFGSTGVYFDVHVAAGSTFTSLSIRQCATNGGTQAYWYDPVNGWTPASNQSYDPASGCVTISVNSSGTSPTIAQLTGTYFAFAAPDTTPPTTTAKLVGTQGVNGWYTSAVTATLSAIDDTSVKQMTYSASGAQTIASTTVAGASATISITAEGQTTLTYFATDNAGNAEAPKTLTVKLDKNPPSLTLPGNQTVEYSDAVNVTVSASDADAGDTIALSASGLSAGLTFTDNGNGTGTVAGTVQAIAGTYTVTFSASDGHNPPVSRTLTIIVNREGAVVTPATSNPTAVKVNTAGGTGGPIVLTAAITEATDDTTNGNISNAVPVTFTLTPVGIGAPLSCNATTSGGGVGGTLTATCTFSNVQVNVYDVQVAVGGNYYTGSAETVLTVYDPSLGFTTGGGTIMHNGVLASFGFNAKYLKSGQIQGQVLYIEHRTTGDVILKSNAMGGLAIVGNTAKIQGKATLGAVGNYSFVVNALDNGEPGTNDQFGLQVTDPSGALVGGLTFDPITLSGGNIQVPQK